MFPILLGDEFAGHVVGVGEEGMFDGMEAF